MYYNRGDGNMTCNPTEDPMPTLSQRKKKEMKRPREQTHSTAASFKEGSLKAEGEYWKSPQACSQTITSATRTGETAFGNHDNGPHELGWFFFLPLARQTDGCTWRVLGKAMGRCCLGAIWRNDGNGEWMWKLTDRQLCVVSRWQACAPQTPLDAMRS